MTGLEGAPTGSLQAVLAAAANGPLLEGVLVPLSNQGKLRVSYNWLYSALNCDPEDNSDFVWVLSKLNDTQVSLSPRDPYAGRQVFASVRDDWDWYVQVQAPHSADWITAVGRNEALTITGGDLLTISLQGWNGGYLSVSPDQSCHDWHNGYRVQSTGSAPYQARTFFVGVTATCQDAIAALPREQLTPAAVDRALSAAGQPAEPQTITRLLAALGSPL